MTDRTSTASTVGMEDREAGRNALQNPDAGVTAELLDRKIVADTMTMMQRQIEQLTGARHSMYDAAIGIAREFARAEQSPALPEAVACPESLRGHLEYARDLLMERKYGSPARSSGHNARIVIEAALAALASPPVGDRVQVWRDVAKAIETANNMDVAVDQVMAVIDALGSRPALSLEGGALPAQAPSVPGQTEAAFRAVCMNRGGDVHPLAAACLVPGCYAEMGEACRNPDKEARP